MPFGRVQDSVTRPTGSASPRTTSSPSAIASTRWLVQRQPVERGGGQARGLAVGEVVGVGGEDVGSGWRGSRPPCRRARGFSGPSRRAPARARRLWRCARCRSWSRRYRPILRRFSAARSWWLRYAQTGDYATLYHVLRPFSPLAWHGGYLPRWGCATIEGNTDDPDRSQPRHRTQDGGAAEPSAGHRHAVRHPRRGARGGRLRLLVRHDGAGDGRPRRHPCRCAEAFQRRSECHADRPGAAGELLHRGGVPRPVAQAAEVRHLHRGPGEGRAGGRRHHQAEGHRAAAHGLLPPHATARRASSPTFPG